MKKDDLYAKQHAPRPTTATAEMQRRLDIEQTRQTEAQLQEDLRVVSDLMRRFQERTLTIEDLGRSRLLGIPGAIFIEDRLSSIDNVLHQLPENSDIDTNALAKLRHLTQFIIDPTIYNQDTFDVLLECCESHIFDNPIVSSVAFQFLPLNMDQRRLERTIDSFSSLVFIGCKLSQQKCVYLAENLSQQKIQSIAVDLPYIPAILGAATCPLWVKIEQLSNDTPSASIQQLNDNNSEHHLTYHHIIFYGDISSYIGQINTFLESIPKDFGIDFQLSFHQNFRVSNTHLKAIELRNISADSVNALRHLSNASIRHVHVYRDACDQSDIMDSFLNSVLQFNALQELTIEPKLTDEQLDRLAEYAQHNRQLRSLNIEPNKLKRRHIDKFNQAICQDEVTLTSLSHSDIFQNGYIISRNYLMQEIDNALSAIDEPTHCELVIINWLICLLPTLQALSSHSVITRIAKSKLAESILAGKLTIPYLKWTLSLKSDFKMSVKQYEVFQWPALRPVDQLAHQIVQKYTQRSLQWIYSKLTSKVAKWHGAIAQIKEKLSSIASAHRLFRHDPDITTLPLWIQAITHDEKFQSILTALATAAATAEERDFFTLIEYLNQLLRQLQCQQDITSAAYQTLIDRVSLSHVTEVVLNHTITLGRKYGLDVTKLLQRQPDTYKQALTCDNAEPQPIAPTPAYSMRPKETSISPRDVATVASGQTDSPVISRSSSTENLLATLPEAPVHLAPSSDDDRTQQPAAQSAFPG